VAPAEELPGHRLNPYFGSLGTSPIESGPWAGPREDYSDARTAGQMDFLAIATRTPTSQLVEAASSLNQAFADRFVALVSWQYGTTRDRGPVNVLEPGARLTNAALPQDRLDLFYTTWLPRHTEGEQPPIVQFLEPHDVGAGVAAQDRASLDSLREAAGHYVRTMQIGSNTRDWSGTREDFAAFRTYLHYLNVGFRLAPTADPNRAGVARDGPSVSRTVVLAQRLTRSDILESVRRRRVYASQDRNLRLTLSVNGHPMGSIVEMDPGTPLRIEVTLSDPDEPDAYYWLSLRRDLPGGELEATRELSGTDIRGDGRVVFTQFKRSTSSEYFLLQVAQAGRNGVDRLWTAPVWLESSRTAR
jgi:hypothetical protein